MIDALGISQHHDAITGTEKQAVADNYAQMLATAHKINDMEYSIMMDEIATDFYGVE